MVKFLTIGLLPSRWRRQETPLFAAISDLSFSGPCGVTTTVKVPHLGEVATTVKRGNDLSQFVRRVLPEMVKNTSFRDCSRRSLSTRKIAGKTR
jgi:hypothetical protein